MQIKISSIKYTSGVIALLLLCLYFPHIMAWLSTAMTTIIGWILFTNKEQSKAQAQAIEDHIHRAIAIHDKLSAIEKEMDEKVSQARNQAKIEAQNKIDGDWQ